MLVDVKVPGLPPYKMRVYDKGCPFLSEQIKQTGIYDRCETTLFCQIIKLGDTVFDIGANIGYYALLASQLVGPEGHVFAFEPEAENFEILKWNINKFGDNNITCANTGVSNFKGEATLYLCSDNPGGHHLHDPVESEKSQIVKITSIDEFIKDKNKKIDFIKIDAQGAEQSILEGMKTTLKKNRNNLKVHLEFAPRALNASAGGLELALETMQRHFIKYMFLDEERMTLSEIMFDDIIKLGNYGLNSKEGLFTNILCFASANAFETVKRSL